MARFSTLRRHLYRYRGRYVLGGLALAIVNACDVALPLVVKYAIDDIAVHQGKLAPLAAVAGVYLGIVCIMATFRYFWRRYFIGTSHEIANDLREELFEHLERQGAAYFTTARTGDLMSRATNDLDAIRQLFAMGLLLTLDTALYLLVVPALMASLSPRLCLYTLLPMPLVPLFVYAMGRVIHARFRAVQDSFGEMSAHVEETAAGIRVVKGFAEEARQIGRFDDLARMHRDQNLALARTQAALERSIPIVTSAAICAVILFGGIEVVKGRISIGAFVAFQSYLLKMIWPMQAIGMVVGLYQRGLASMRRIDEVMDTRPEVEDGPETLPDARVERGEIVVKGLTFRYPGAGAGADSSVRPALAGIDLKIEAGKTVAIVGPIGAGKSTLLELLPRLFDPPPGAIFVDGLDVRRYPVAELRRAIGAVPQETFLFSDTIAANVALGVPGASREAIEAATEKAAVRAEIAALPKGFEMVLGERGVNLSGGQRQRIAIARAILRQPRILLLDDCLSSVDAETEAAILSRLREELRGRTAIVVSHRIATVRDADRIFFLSDGRLVEEGTHDELAARPGGLYAEMYRKQQLERELATAA